MSTKPSRHHLEVPGGRVYYEVRGSGPVVLVIGQPMTSAAFGPLADLLAKDHTVVTYDPHRLGASTIDDPSLAVTPEIEADHLAYIIDAVGGQTADVFGSVAVGAASRGEIARRSAEALAERIGTPAVVFPGDHGGFMADPATFAAAIQQVMTSAK
jgi:hypothetical protein